MSLQEHLQTVLKKHGPWLSSLPGVAGFGVGLNPESQICIIIYCDGLSPECRISILEKVPGEPVSFKETGPITPLESFPDAFQ